jgi:hypothetical protein
VKTIWEHDYRTLRETKEMKQFLDTFDILTNLDPHDAFFGRRVNVFKLFRDAQESETLEYADYTSLYPWVNKTKVFPIGHAKIIRENFENISNYFGLVKCKVLAPPTLPCFTGSYKGQTVLSFVQVACYGKLFRVPAFKRGTIVLGNVYHNRSSKSHRKGVSCAPNSRGLAF